MDRPKSESLIWPSLSIRMLSGLMSLKRCQLSVAAACSGNIPMDEAELVDRFNRKNTLCDVETGDVFGECVILDQHRHEIASR